MVLHKVSKSIVKARDACRLPLLNRLHTCSRTRQRACVSAAIVAGSERCLQLTVLSAGIRDHARESAAVRLAEMRVIDTASLQRSPLFFLSVVASCGNDIIHASVEIESSTVLSVSNGPKCMPGARGGTCACVAECVRVVRAVDGSDASEARPPLPSS